jgi:hypothetical protein
MLGVTEPIAALSNTDCTGLPRPIVDVLKQVMVDRPIMGEIEKAGGERFVDAGLEHGELVLVEFSLIVQVGLVDKD